MITRDSYEFVSKGGSQRERRRRFSVQTHLLALSLPADLLPPAPLVCAQYPVGWHALDPVPSDFLGTSGIISANHTFESKFGFTQP